MVAAAAYTLLSILVLAGLIGATLAYMQIVKRRAAARRQAAELKLIQESGARGVDRLFGGAQGSGKKRP